MVPLTTVQGFAPEALRALLGARPLYLWGSGDVALDVLTSLRRMGFSPCAFFDTRVRAGESVQVCGLPCLPTQAVLGSRAVPRPFVVIASADYRLAAARACVDAGFARGRDFIDQFDIPRPVAVVELCAPDGRCMAAAAFERLLAKLLADQPLLCHLELSWQGDPGRHPELARLVAYAERFVPCTVNTALHTLDDVQGVLAAAPTRLNFIVRGHGASYDAAFGVGSWARAQAALETLRAAETPDRTGARIMLRYLRAPEAASETFSFWQGEVAGSSLRLNIEWPYVTPYDLVLAYCREGVHPAGEAGQFAALPWSLETALQLAASERDQPCLSQRIFPVIGVDGAVAACHLYRAALLAPDYLACDWPALLAARRTCVPCQDCQAQGLHRLDIEVQARRHPAWRVRLLGKAAD